MKLNSLVYGLLLLFLTSASPLPIVKGYFMFPVRPGERNYLSGSMGELRNNHFHGGLDIKTSGRIGLPIYAAAEGYISRISIEAGGYGKRIAITHPNGYVTHYGHLDHFSEEIEDYVMSRQYQQRTFELEIFPKPGEIPIVKGAVFAYSGNTGASGGPHLHFEVRDTKDNVYNPLDFGFEEIIDKTSPRVYKIALKPLDVKSTVDGSNSKKYYKLGFLNGRYIVNQNIEAFGQIGLEIKAYDLMDGTRNQYGIQEIQVWIDGIRHFEQRIDYYPILFTRHINLHVDYQDVYERGDWYQKCYVSAGNALPFYKFEADKGALKIYDGKEHEVQVFIKDSYNNTSLLEFSIQGRKDDKVPVARNLIYKPDFKYDLEGSTLRMVLSNVERERELEIYSFYKKQKLKPVAFTDNSNIYTYNLNSGIPDSINAADSNYILPYKYMILPGKKTEYFHEPLKISFGANSINDTLFLEHNVNDSVIDLHETLVPLSSYIRIEWTVKNPKFVNSHQVYFEGKRGKVFLGNKWEGNKVIFRTRSFGNYILAQDTTPPSVRVIYNTGNELKLRIRDNLSGIKQYDVFIGNEWVLMEYDAKWNVLTSKRKSDSPLFRGPCKIAVRDNAGNTKTIDLEL